MIFATEEARDNLLPRDNDFDDGYVLVAELDNFDGVDTTILVKFNDVLFAKSYHVIDYGYDIDPIGTIDVLISNKYVPMHNNETNNEKLLNALVYACDETSMVLYYDSVFHLFEKIEYLK